MIKSEIIFVDQIYLFFGIFSNLKFLATPGRRTMHPGRLIMDINNVLNDISDNFYFDHKAVQFDYKVFFLFIQTLNFLVIPGGRTMQPRKLIMKINVVENDISGNFYFDHKAVQS